MSLPRGKSPALRLIAASIILLAAILGGLWIWQTKSPSTPEPIPAPIAQPDLTEPSEDFATFQYVLHTGGCAITQPVAIAWLDRTSREQAALSEAHVDTLIEMLVDDGHSSWHSGYRQHLFNSACNALRAQSDPGIDERLARVLLTHATTHPDRILRLYALQHIDSLRKAGHLDGELASEIHAVLTTIATAPDNDIAGTALQLLAEWDGPASDAPPAILELAAQTAANRERPVDVRVSAIHTAGPTALEIARTIAVDPTEPVILRKAAIARIGQDGSANDLPSLQTLASESTRIAQAAEPAILNLQDRLQNPNKPAPRPY